MKEYAHEFKEVFHYTPSDFEKLGGVYPIRFGQNKAKSNYFVGPRVIDYYSIHFVLSGSVSLSHGEEVVHLSKRDLFCLYPHIKYKYWVNEPETQLSMRWFAFNGVQAVPLLERIGISPKKPYLCNKVNEELNHVLTNLFQVVQRKERNGDLDLQASMYRMFGLLSKAKTAQPAKTKETAWLQKSIHYIENHYMEGIAVSDVVQVAGVHRSHLYSEFNRLLEISPQLYLIKLRMEKAVEMLKQKSLTITEISRSVGYPDLYSFSRAFYKFFGNSPSDYRVILEAKNQTVN